MKLRISDTLALPIDTVTSTLIIYGGKGMGKSNLGSVLAEELAAAGQRFSVIDPMGVFWGLRHSADGKGPGIEVLILGGKHGDFPLEPTGGGVAADLVADENANVVLDISRKPDGKMWSIGERIRFVADYCTRLYERQGESRRPILQIIDEAARFCPQQIPHGAMDIARCSSALSTMVEEGRNVGIGVCLITQRSARMNKAVSEVADCMVAFRIVGPLSIGAVLDWFGDHVEKEKWKELIERLRKLPRGTALVVSPGWLDFEGEAAIRLRHTFDSSATPKMGQERRASGPGAKIDLARYLERMKATIEKAKAEDPRELKKKIADLMRELAKKPVVTPAGPIPHNVLMRASREQVRSAILARDAEWQAAVEPYLSKARDIAHASRVALEEISRLPKPKPPAFTIAGMEVAIDTKMPVNRVNVSESHVATGPWSARVRPPVQLSDSNGRSLKPGALRMLAACAQWHPNGISEGQVASMAKVKRSGGSFSSYKSNLVVGGFIRVQNDLWYATDEGLSHGGLDRVGPAPSSTDEMVNLWKPKLKPGAQRMLQVLIAHGGAALTDEQLSELADISDSGGSFSSYKSNLVTAGLAVKPGRGMIAANKEALFL